MHETGYSIRQATQADIPGISTLVAELASNGHLLPRSRESITKTLEHWVVARSKGQLLGCGSLVPYSTHVAEVRSLAVVERARGNGLGGEILAALIGQAISGGFETLFALTRAIGVFKTTGFSGARRTRFPEKVWRDCLLCPMLFNCSEQTMVLDLRSLGPLRATRAGALVEGVFDGP